MKLAFFLFLLLANLSTSAQTTEELDSLWKNVRSSVFRVVTYGSFGGTTNGFIQVLQGEDTLLLDFANTKTDMTAHEEWVYAPSRQIYQTSTTSGKTAVEYEFYNLANILSVKLNGKSYAIGIIDGAACINPIRGLSFHYAHEGTTEYLTLTVTQNLVLSDYREIMEKEKLSYDEAKKKESDIMVLAGSTLIIRIDKCEGFKGKSGWKMKSYGTTIEQKGTSDCNYLKDGEIIFRDSNDVTLTILSFKSGIYQGQLDMKTKKLKVQPIKNTGNQQISEDGEFLDGALYNGKIYIYDTNGLLETIAIIKNGKYYGLAIIE